MGFGKNLPICQEIGGIIKWFPLWCSIDGWSPNDGGNSLTFLRNCNNCVIATTNKIVELEEIARRVTTYGEFGKYNDIRLF